MAGFNWVVNSAEINEVIGDMTDVMKKMKALDDVSLNITDYPVGTDNVPGVSSLFSEVNSKNSREIEDIDVKIEKLSNLASDVLENTRRIEMDINDQVEGSTRITDTSSGKRGNFSYSFSDSATLSNYSSDLIKKYGISLPLATSGVISSTARPAASVVSSSKAEVVASQDVNTNISDDEVEKSSSKDTSSDSDDDSKKILKKSVTKTSNNSYSTTGATVSSRAVSTLKSSDNSSVKVSNYIESSNNTSVSNNISTDNVNSLDDVSSNGFVKIDDNVDTSSASKYSDSNLIKPVPDDFKFDNNVTDDERASHYFTNPGNSTSEVVTPTAPVQENNNNNTQVVVEAPSNNAPSYTPPSNNNNNNSASYSGGGTSQVVEAPQSTVEAPQQAVEAPSDTPSDAPITSDISDDTPDLFDVDDSEVTTKVKTSSKKSGNKVLPVVGGLGLAAATAAGVKFYRDRKNSNDIDLDDDRPSNDNMFWSEEGQKVINSEESLDEDYTSDETDTDEVIEEMPDTTYHATNNLVDSDSWEMDDDEDETIDLLGNVGDIDGS